MADHPPAARRAVLRALKHGTHPAALIDDARAIDDPGHAAGALLTLAADERLPAHKIADLIEESRRLLRKVDRPGRLAEAWGDGLASAVSIHRGPGVDTAVAALQDSALKAIIDMPPGRWTADAIIAVAPHMPARALRRMMQRAIANQGFEVEAGKTLLDIEPALADVVKEHASPEVASLLLGRVAQHGAGAIDDAVAAAWQIDDEIERREALRVIVWRIEDADGLAAVAATCRDRDPADRVAVMTSIAGRADRLGLDAHAYFAKAVDALGRVQGPMAGKLHRKLAQAMERAGLEAPPRPDAPPFEAPLARPASPTDIPVQPMQRHVLALVDGYSGGMGAPHLRAIARAAPLCAAFDLDLALVGFPEVHPETLISLVEAETNVGEGAGHARLLHDDGRVHIIHLDGGLPKQWPGHPVATTPHPEDGKAVALDAAKRPVCLLMGLGKNGIPRKILHAVGQHHELTGQGISLETATAMGILADRLGALPTK